MHILYTERMTNTRSIQFDSLAKSSRFLDLSLIINEMTGLNVAIYPPNSLAEVKLTSTKVNPCCEWLRQRQTGLARCNECERKRFQAVLESKQHVVEVCHAGFLDIALPIIEQDKVVGIISTGQILAEPQSQEAFNRLRERLAALGIPGSLIRKTYHKLIYLSPRKLSAILKLLKFFSAYFFETQQDYASLIHGDNPSILSVRRYIKEHPDGDLSLDRLADLSGYSRWHLCRIFQVHTGKKLSDFIQQTRVDRAKYLLQNTDLSITQIAMAAGFGSISHFNRLFRQLEKNSPSKFRQTWK